MLAGDDDPTPMSQRPAFLALSTSSDRRFFRAYAHLSRLIFSSASALLGVLLQGGSGGDADLRALVTTIEGRAAHR